ncbi:MAG TPA: hypothetical protein VNO55_04525 [Polyangia bacterium]|nr:hypothetical protein [Polyangia bacterium]
MEKLFRRTLDCGFVALVGLAGLLWSGCYNPSIVNGGLHCSENGRCPEGFSCHVPTGRCYRPDSGPTEVNCPPTTPLCAEQPTDGGACSAVCQNGCSCGQRCNVAGNISKCVPAGTKTLGQLCTRSSPSGFDDCAPGLTCLNESCGGLSRCYRLCTGNDQCKVADDVLCRINIEITTAGVRQPTPFFVCDVPHDVCDPIAKSGCAAPALSCFVLNSGQTLCDCEDPKAGAEGAKCNTYPDCKAGFTCVSLTVAGVAQSSCRTVCAPGKTTCPAGQTCKAIGAKYGYCAPP